MSDFNTNFVGEDDFINLDFTDVKEVDFSAVPPGNYLAVISEAKVEPSSEKKTPGLKVTFDLIGCVDNPAPRGAEKCQGKKAFATFWLTEKSMGFNKPFFNAVSGGEATVVNFKPSQLVGTNVGLVLTKGTYNKTNESGQTETRENNPITGYFPATNL